MPLFQPSNITPSTFAGVGGGTIDVFDNIEITWQLNGNSPMTGFQINIFDKNNSLVAGTGIIFIDPFYPTDNKGNPKFYTYKPEEITWNDWGLINNREYNLQITQHWGDATDDQHTAKQFSQSAFITREKPSLKIATASGNETFETIDAVFLDFIALYFQSQNDAVEWIRWQLYQDGILFDDTGILNTQVLRYTAQNMQSGKTYKIVCTVQTESGIEVIAEKVFNVEYTISEMEGEHLIDCKDRASNLLTWEEIELPEGESIEGVSNDGNYSFKNGGLILPIGSTISWSKSIPADWSIAGKINIEIPFEKEEVSFQNIPQEGLISTIKINKNDNVIVVGQSGSSSIVASIYTLNNNTPNFIKTLPINHVNNSYSSYTARTNTISFNEEKGLILICGEINGYSTSGGAISEGFSYLYSIKGETITYLTSISTYGSVISSSFSPNGELIVLGYNNGSAYVYLTEKLSEQKQFHSSSAPAKTVEFSSDGSYLLIGGGSGITLAGETTYFKSASIYLANGSEFTYKGELEGAISGELGEKVGVEYAIFTPDNKYLIIVPFQENLQLLNSVYCYDIANGDFTFLSSFTPELIGSTASINGIYYSKPANALMFSVGGVMINYMSVYYFDRGAFKHIGDSNYSGNGSLLSNDGKKVITWGGYFNSSYAKIHWSWDVQEQLFSFGGFTVNKYFGLQILNPQNEILHFKKTIDAGAITETSYNASIYFSINKHAATVSINGESETLYFEESSQQTISKIVAYGKQNIDFIHIVNVSSLIPENSIPEWGYNTEFLTHFDTESLNAGQREDEKFSADIYRQSSSEFIKLFSAPKSITSIRDFSWRSGGEYNYSVFYRIGGKYTDKANFNVTPVCKTQREYLLLETTQDEEYPDVYHVLNYWRFGNNFESSNRSNNNTPNFLTNFTPYRLKQPVSRNSKSGVLTSLLSNTVNGVYKDTVEQMEDLYSLSNSTNTFFLKDTKGNMYMVDISGAITQTVNEKSTASEVKISLPWEESGSCKGVSIIQIPTDENWGNKEKN